MTGDDMLRAKLQSAWDPAVTAVARNTSLLTVDGPASGFDFLTNKWPGAHGVAFAKARRAAMGAMSGTASAGDARTAFILACEDAGCLVRSD